MQTVQPQTTNQNRLAAATSRRFHSTFWVCSRNKHRLSPDGSGANFKKARRADPDALGERESLAWQIGPKFKLCTRTLSAIQNPQIVECHRYVVKVGIREDLLFDVPNYRVAKNEDVAVLDIPPELQLKALPLRKTPVQAERRVRASQYFRSFWAAWRTIAGYEAVHMNRKGQACESAAGAKVGLLQRFIVSLFAATN